MTEQTKPEDRSFAVTLTAGLGVPGNNEQKEEKWKIGK